MDSDKVIAKMRKIENAQPPELYELVSWQERIANRDGTVTNRYAISDEKNPPGYLLITFYPETEEITAAEININFEWLIGLNRSPIQLRLVAAHVLQYIKGEEDSPAP